MEAGDGDNLLTFYIVMTGDRYVGTTRYWAAENIKYARKFSQLRWARLAARKVANGRVYKMTTCIIDKREVM